MQKQSIYTPLITELLDVFGKRLKTAVLFGSRARNQARTKGDHDIFLVIESCLLIHQSGKKKYVQQSCMSLFE